MSFLINRLAGEVEFIAKWARRHGKVRRLILLFESDCPVWRR